MVDKGKSRAFHQDKRTQEVSAMFSDLQQLGWLSEDYADCQTPSPELVDVDDWRKRPRGLAILSHNIIIHSPRLASVRPYPSIIAHHLPLPLPTTSASVPTSNTRPRPTRELPLPTSILAAPPFTFGPASLMERYPSDDRYFWVYWPKLAEGTTKRYTNLANASLSGANPGDPLTSSSSSTHIPSSPVILEETIREQSEDHGGVLSLYHKPETNSTLPTASGEINIVNTGIYISSSLLEFMIHSAWVVDSEPVAWEWLYQPRKWITETLHTGRSEKDDKKQELAAPETETAPKLEPERLIRGPAYGPSPPSSSTPLFGSHHNSPSPPTFILLFSDTKTRLYFPSPGIIPTPNTFAAPIEMLTLALSTRENGTVKGPQWSRMNPVKNSGNLIMDAQGRRRIRRNQATIYLKPEDSRIFFAYRCHSVCGSEEDNLWTSPDAAATTKEKELPINATGLGITSLANGDVEMTDEHAAAPVVSGNEESAAVKLVRRVPLDEQEEDWLNVVDVNVDTIDGVQTLSAVPMRKVYFPKVAGISTPPRLIGMTFRESESTRLGEISDWELPIPEEDDDNIVQLVCFFAGDNKKTIEKVCKLEQKRFELLEAFSTLASPSLGVSRKDLTRSWRLEWVAAWSEASSTCDGPSITSKTLKSSPNLAFTASLGGDSDKIQVLNRIERQSQSVHLHRLAIDICTAIHNRCDISDLLRVACTKGKFTGPECDAVLKDVGRTLKAQSHYRAQSMVTSEWFLPLLKMQARLFSLADDERHLISLIMLDLIAGEHVFSSSQRPVMVPASGAPNASANKIKAYDQDAIWLLNSWADWWLRLMKRIIRHALQIGDNRDPCIAFLIHHPYPRTLIRHLNSHIQRYIYFIWNLRQPIAPHPASLRLEERDAASASLASTILRDDVERSGLKVDALSKVLQTVNEIFADQLIASNELEESALLARVSPSADSTLESAFNVLQGDASILKSQATLLLDNVTNEKAIDGTVDSDRQRFDVITKEPLPTKLTHPWLLRRCQACRGMSVVYPIRAESAEFFGTAAGQDSQIAAVTHNHGHGVPGLIGGGGSDMLGKVLKSGYVIGSSWWRWMMRWSRSCICGGQWETCVP